MGQAVLRWLLSSFPGGSSQGKSCTADVRRVVSAQAGTRGVPARIVSVIILRQELGAGVERAGQMLSCDSQLVQALKGTAELP